MDYRSTDWGNPKGIKCAMETTPITNISRPFKLGTDWRLFREEEEVIRGMRFPVSFINITAMTEFRKDAHTSVHTLRQGKLLTREQQADPASFADCIHWCLPGLPDTWNDDFFKKRSGVREKDPLQATTEGIYTCRAYGGRTVVYNGCDAFGLTVGTTLRHATPLPIFKVSIDEASDREYDNQGNRHGIWPSVPRLSGHRGAFIVSVVDHSYLVTLLLLWPTMPSYPSTTLVIPADRRGGSLRSLRAATLGMTNRDGVTAVVGH
ncbi:hypothetical protein BHE74_00031557 [Ensete ventricosum]|nr:hypothetical protein BHE74_00031557 [Ensete ventricosum]